MINFPEIWCFGILIESRNFPGNWCFGRSTQPRLLAEQFASQCLIWGYPNFRTPIIWLSGYFRVNPKFIIDNHQFAALHVLAVLLSVHSCTCRVIKSACAQIGDIYTAAVEDKPPMDCNCSYVLILIILFFYNIILFFGMYSVWFFFGFLIIYIIIIFFFGIFFEKNYFNIFIFFENLE